MFILRATKRLLKRVGSPTLRDGEQSTTLLGDWYATTLPWRPQVALLVNEATLLPVLMPLAPAATMPARIADEVSAVLAAHGTRNAIIETEREHMRQWRIAPTANRSVVGIMNEFTYLANTFRVNERPSLPDLAMRLSQVPCGPLYKRHGSPDRELRGLLQSIAP